MCLAAGHVEGDQASRVWHWAWLHSVRDCVLGGQLLVLPTRSHQQ
jgi:hypothetical protein